ncbi:hypothetical protein Ciccas_014150, partial [Cichlidogyrus casuarinus]
SGESSDGVLFHYGVRILVNESELGKIEPMNSLASYEWRSSVLREIEHRIIKTFDKQKLFQSMVNFQTDWNSTQMEDSAFLKKWRQWMEAGEIARKNFAQIEKELLRMSLVVEDLQKLSRELQGRLALQGTDECSKQSGIFVAILNYNLKTVIRRQSDRSELLAHNLVDNKLLTDGLKTFKSNLESVKQIANQGDIRDRHLDIVRAIKKLGFSNLDDRAAVLSRYLDTFQERLTRLVKSDHLAVQLKKHLEAYFDQTLASLLNP